MGYRHEWKVEISQNDKAVLRNRLSPIMKRDGHAKNGLYRIRSLYFDSPADSALRDKIDGVSRREKFRLRLYDGDTETIFLEKKEKHNSLSRKTKVPVSKQWVENLLNGNLPESAPGLLEEFRAKYILQRLSPKVIVEYTREPFVYETGNVRVTMDSSIETGPYPGEFLEEKITTLPTGNPVTVLEIKWDAFLPDVIRQAVALSGRRAGAFSKYARCRMYG